jgi:hypothetical protein
MNMRCRPVLGLLACLLALGSAQPGLAWVEPPGPQSPASPAVVSVAPMPPNISNGGRAVAVTVNPNNSQHIIVASESGGLFKSVDGGASWFHLNNLPMFRLTDVRYAPGDANVVIATGWSDSHVTNQGGIWRSADGGTTWSKPADSNPPAGLICPAWASAWGIAFEPSSNRVYVGTDCGLSISANLGATWPTHTVPANIANPAVFAVAAAASGLVYICSPRGFQWSTTGGSSWTSLDATRSCSQVHALAVSPLEGSVVFLARKVLPSTCPLLSNGLPGNNGAVFEGDVSGGTITWNQVSPVNCLGPLGRAPWVAVHRHDFVFPQGIDVWFSDGLNLYRRNCSVGGPGQRCGPGTAGWVANGLSHPDVNHIGFDAGSNCPLVVAHDGGLDRASNSLTLGTCTPTWVRVGGGPSGYNAQQIYDLTGQIGPLGQVDLYFGTQDNALWASPDRGVTWPYGCCNEGGGIQVARYADADRRVTFNDYGDGSNNLSERYYAGRTAWRNPLSPPAQDAPTRLSQGVYIQWKQPNRGITSTLSVTTDYGNIWNDIPLDIFQGRVGAPFVVFSGDNAVIYQIVEDWAGRNKLIKILGIRRNGTFSGVTITQLFSFSLGGLPNIPPGEGALGFQQVLGVDPFDPNHLLAPDLADNRMEVSTNGGVNWTADVTLTNLVVGYDPISPNEFLFDVAPSLYLPAWMPPGTGSQVHAVAFDPFHRGRILVGTEAAGIFISSDGGASWEAVPGSRQITGITDFFFIENNADFPQDTAIVATYGRGLWRLTIPLGTAHPFIIPDSVADLWDDGWLRDPSTGDLVASDLLLNPDFCPPCRLYIADKGEIRDLEVDPDGILIGLLVSPGTRLLGSTTDGVQIAPQLTLTEVGSVGAFDDCPACLDTLDKVDGIIRGMVTDGDGKLLYYIGGTGDLPGQDDFWTSEPPFVEPDTPYAAPTEPYLVLTTEHMFPQPSVGLGGDVEVHGFNFCSGGPCSAITLKIGDRVLTNALVPKPDGSFMAEFDIDEPFGYYAITAEQTTAASASLAPAGSTNLGTAWLAVGLGGDETEEVDATIYLPLAWR